MLAALSVKPVRSIHWRLGLLGVSLSFLLLALFEASAQGLAKENPHASGKVSVPPGANEVAYCSKCHTAGCPMPHPELVAVNWPTNGRVNLPGGKVSCNSCHTPGFRRRVDAFLAQDQKGLCAVCHFGAHALPDAHPYTTRCSSCHTSPRNELVTGHPATRNMTADIDEECLRCHYDGAITHPVGIKNTKKPAPDLPLAQDGAITCVTCHFGHSNQNQNTQLLRANNRRGGLCLKCHDDL